MSETFLFLPQMRMAPEVLLAKARLAESLGFTGIALMDHLAPPRTLDQPMYEAMAMSTYLLAGTSTLRVGALVLCDAFRHPAVLAQSAVTLDHLSGGRFELGIGAGSVPAEFDTFGVTPTAVGARVGRLGETLEILARLWTGEPFDYAGEHFQLVGAQQRPTPLGQIPIVIGGTGPRMLGLIREHATWWNIPVSHFDRFDELRPQVGSARPSLQLMVGLVTDETQRDEITERSRRRFPGLGDALFVGDPDETVAHFRQLRTRGVERFYVWFTDFAPEPTLTAFAEHVLPAIS